MGKRKIYKIRETTVKKDAVRKVKHLGFQGQRPVFRWVNIFLPFFVLSLLVSQIMLSNKVATEGEKLKNLEQQKSELYQRKINLDQEAAQLSALTRVEKESREKLGMFSAIKNVQYLSSEKMATILK